MPEFLNMFKLLCGRSEYPDQVFVMLIVLRLATADTDLLIWTQCPEVTHELSGVSNVDLSLPRIVNVVADVTLE